VQSTRAWAKDSVESAATSMETAINVRLNDSEVAAGKMQSGKLLKNPLSLLQE